jgi:hypothetical protein
MSKQVKTKDKYQAFKEQYESARKTMMELSLVAFKEFTKDIFDKFPDVESFGWNEYTDYYNDGDTCEFHAHADYEEGIYINGESGYDEEYENFKEARSEIIEMMSNFDDDILYDLYGDHCKVTIHRDGKAVIEKYTDHD